MKQKAKYKKYTKEFWSKMNDSDNLCDEYVQLRIANDEFQTFLKKNEISAKKNLCHFPRCRKESCYGTMTTRGWVQSCEKHIRKMIDDIQ